MSDCIFCAIAAGAAPARVIHEGTHTLTFLDINPATTGHALVIPRRHARDLLDVEQSDLEEMASVAQQVAQAAVEHLGAEGVNLLQATGAVAFQTVFHVHLHVIPRYADDGLRLPWTPTPGDDTAMDRAAEVLRAGL